MKRIEHKFYRHSIAFFFIPTVSTYTCGRAVEGNIIQDVRRIEFRWGYALWQWGLN